MPYKNLINEALNMIASFESHRSTVFLSDGAFYNFVHLIKMKELQRSWRVDSTTCWADEILKNGLRQEDYSSFQHDLPRSSDLCLPAKDQRYVSLMVMIMADLYKGLMWSFLPHRVDLGTAGRALSGITLTAVLGRI